jgi:predicted Holliday junction resolvase-like endonuclease
MTESEFKVKMNYALYCLKRKHKEEYANCDFDIEEYHQAKRIVAEETSKRFKGKKLSEETKARMSKARKGTMTDEHKQIISEVHKGKVPWNKNKKGVSAETAEKLRETAKRTWEWKNSFS